MACNITVSGRSFPCKDKIGGIKRVWIKLDSRRTNGVRYCRMELSPDAAAAMATVLLRCIQEVRTHKNTGSFQQTVTSSVENGTVFFSQVVELTMPNLSLEITTELYDLLKSRLVRDLFKTITITI